MGEFFNRSLRFAEVMDAWRVVPRIIILAYGYLVYKLYTWYRGMTTVEKTECSDSILATLIESGVDPEVALTMSCVVVDVVGGPTGYQTAFVTAIIGLATGIFAFYVNSGRSWGGAHANSSKFTHTTTDEQTTSRSRK